MKCLNNPNRNYKGNESSPKGLGYCAFAEETGKVMEGLDGTLWEVKFNSIGNKIWIRKGHKQQIIYPIDSKEYKIIQLIERLKEEFGSASYNYYEEYYGPSGKDEEFNKIVNKLREELNIPEYEKY